MPQHWLLKTEPGEYAFDDLVAAGAAGDCWDGVRNHQAAAFMREMQSGDEVFIYHSGRERGVVGTAEVIRAAYSDPTDTSGRFVAVDVRAGLRLAEPVSLAAIKSDPAFADFQLVRQPRLSVMPVGARHWQRIMALGRASG